MGYAPEMVNEGIDFWLIQILKATLLLKYCPTINGAQFFHINFKKHTKNKFLRQSCWTTATINLRWIFACQANPMIQHLIHETQQELSKQHQGVTTTTHDDVILNVGVQHVEQFIHQSPLLRLRHHIEGMLYLQVQRQTFPDAQSIAFYT